MERQAGPRAEQAAGLPAGKPVTLDAGDRRSGLTHLWRHHKDVFCNPARTARLLSEAVGDPNCRVVVSLSQVQKAGEASCVKKIVLHNERTRTYCVLNEADGELRLVSWPRENDAYGNRVWPLK